MAFPETTWPPITIMSLGSLSDTHVFINLLTYKDELFILEVTDDSVNVLNRNAISFRPNVLYVPGYVMVSQPFMEELLAPECTPLWVGDTGLPFKIENLTDRWRQFVEVAVASTKPPKETGGKKLPLDTL